MNDNRRHSVIGFSYAWNGLREVIKSEGNFRVHLIAAAAVIAAGLFFKLDLLQWALIFLTICVVLITEMINTSIEKIIDYIKPEINPNAKIIKDISAGAVLLAAITAIIIGLLIFIPEINETFM
ncbi:diacylglycerol kinase family protein [Virgibacillus siamensis]|uniref:diacylglycerol kinase family protein n=1 Tax=Virgibacillus siamensis TaxID=480071 RepID=UPI001FE6FA34|nr:diacylglycerol kinase family protein [Virgibacillus siamensis]